MTLYCRAVETALSCMLNGMTQKIKDGRTDIPMLFNIFIALINAAHVILHILHIIANVIPCCFDVCDVTPVVESTLQVDVALKCY